MSSYLNIYGITKEKGERVLLVSYSRYNEIYQKMDGILGIPWNGNGEDNYRKLSINDISTVVEELNKTISNVDKRIIEYEKHANGNADLIEDILSQKEYREGLDDVLKRLRFLSDIIYNAKEGFSKVEKVICSIT